MTLRAGPASLAAATTSFSGGNVTEPAEPSPAAALARDMAALGRTDAAYLRRARGVLERLVLKRPLPEAHAFTALLAEAREM